METWQTIAQKLPYQVLQEVVKRVDLVFQVSFRRIKAGEEPF